FDWWAATWVAMRLESPELRPQLAAAATSDEPLQRALAARGLGALKDQGSLERLLALTKDKDAPGARQALPALGAPGEPRAAEAAAALIDAPSDVVRREALRTLALVPGERALSERLVGLVASPEPWIRAAALGALARADRDGFALVLSGLD